MSRLQEFIEDPFKFCDSLNLSTTRLNLNIFQTYKKNRKIVLGVAIFSLTTWFILGFDSTIGQPLHFLYNMPRFLTNNISWSEWTQIFVEQYGKEMHWSALVIYGFMYYGLSRHFDKKGITKSKNVAYAMSLTVLSIAVFEFYWMFSFAYFQRQPWIIKPQMPQLRIHIQNIGFLALGIIGVLYMYVDSCFLDNKGDVIGRLYRFNWNKKAVFLIVLSVGSAVFWWMYPFTVERFEVETTQGVWMNSNRFPQTLYTIDLDTSDNVNAGVWFWMENNLVHFVNTLVKTLFSTTIFYIGNVKFLCDKPQVTIEKKRFD